MENIIAMIAITAVIFLSKQKFIPIIILAYYAAYLLVEYASFSIIRDLSLNITAGKIEAIVYYTSSSAIELLIIIALCINTNKYKKVGIIYAVFVLTSMIFNATQAVSMSIESNWFVNFYTIRQQIAIPLDIIFAILGSDNFVSRKFYITLNNSSDGNNADNRNNPD